MYGNSGMGGSGPFVGGKYSMDTNSDNSDYQLGLDRGIEPPDVPQMSDTSDTGQAQPPQEPGAVCLPDGDAAFFIALFDDLLGRANPRHPISMAPRRFEMVRDVLKQLVAERAAAIAGREAAEGLLLELAHAGNVYFGFTSVSVEIPHELFQRIADCVQALEGE